MDAIANQIASYDGRTVRHLHGYYFFEQGQRKNVADEIHNAIEDSIRFIQTVMQYGSPADVWQMSCYEFGRDLVRAKQRQDAQIRELEKMKQRQK